jgi:L-serine/L-threonine ammonia-lyase
MLSLIHIIVGHGSYKDYMKYTPLHIETPLVESHPLSQCLGCSVWLKMEALQPSDSFKLRGIGHACAMHAQRGVRRFVCSSGGNAGLAVAYCGRRMDIPVTVIVPDTTTTRAIDRIRGEGAEVVIHGRSWQESHEHAIETAGSDVAYIHPFDDPLLWDGHSTMIDRSPSRASRQITWCCRSVAAGCSAESPTGFDVTG